MRHLRKDYDTIQPQPGETSIGVDEPVFVLRAKDPSAPVAVREWARHVHNSGGDPTLVARVVAWADEMEAWRKQNHPDRTVADVDLEDLR